MAKQEETVHPPTDPEPAPEGPPPRRRLPRTRYVSASPETWSLIRGAYLSGLSAPTVAARFGVSVTALRKRAAREGWTKRAYAAGATPWIGPVRDAAVAAPAPPQEPPDAAARAEAELLEVWRQPPRFRAADVARKGLAGAVAALKSGKGLEALRLARAAAEIARLDDSLDYAEVDVAQQEAESEARVEQMQFFMRERALSLAADILAGRELPPDFEAVKAELARLEAMRAEAEAAGR